PPPARTAIYPLSLHDALPISLRVEGQEVLQALNDIRHHGAGHTEHQQSERVANPALLCLRVDGGHAIDCSLERPKHGRQEVALADRKSTRLNSSHDQISYAVF